MAAVSALRMLSSISTDSSAGVWQIGMRSSADSVLTATETSGGAAPSMSCASPTLGRPCARLR
jgi:hypothetical protein